MTSQVNNGAYIPYQAKRNSTASITSLQQVSHRPLSEPSSSSSLSNSSSTALVRPSHVRNDSIQSPQPQRMASSTQQWSPASRNNAVSPPPSASTSQTFSTNVSSSPTKVFPQHRPSSSFSMNASHVSSRNRSPERLVNPSSRSQTPSSPIRVNSSASNQALQQRASLSQEEQQQLTVNIHGKAFYHSKFQPQGVRRDRTEEYMGKRKSRGEGKKLDEGRLARRLEKLVALHFPPPELDGPKTATTEKSNGLSTFATLSALRTKSAKELWSSVAGSRGEIEKAEQSIVKWQEDSEAKFCPICMASFGIKTRRHHCRLCGRVVCFLPPTPARSSASLSDLSLEPPTSSSTTPIRRERCSTFFTYEYRNLASGSEKNPTGVIVEIEPAEADLRLGAIVPEFSNGGQLSDLAPNAPKEKDERKKVRVCRECLNTVMRQQLKTLPVRMPTWLKLYEVLVQLEKEIEQILPEFQELTMGLQKTATRSVQAASAALRLRKRLLTDLASYDTIAKRIRDLPLSVEAAAPGGSQDRLQQAISARATLFLQEKLALLRTLGDLDDLDGTKGKKKKGSGTAATGEGNVKTLASLLGAEAANGANRLMNEKVGAELEISEKLKVLLEQEALVRCYVDDANAKRQFEDAASLQMSLNELREEIKQQRAALP